jgi:probable F420-dependent oxidoreductase
VSAIKIGVQLHPQHCSINDLRAAWKKADALGVDSIWVWDHFYPLYGDPAGAHFEGWSLVAAMACETTTPQIGTMVSCNSYRNPDLLADMARTIDHLSGGRVCLGIGSGWNERDHTEFQYPFGTPKSRIEDFGDGLGRITARLAKLTPPPIGPMPILIGAGKPRGLRLTAKHANAWNWFGSPDEWKRCSQALDDACAKEGRNPAEIERTVLFNSTDESGVWREYVDRGATHLILGLGTPFDFAPVQKLLAEAKG